MDRERLAAAAVVALFIVFGAVAASQRYAVSDPWKLYGKVVREFIAAGARGDSVALAAGAAGAAPVTWILDAARRRPEIIAGWARRLDGVSGERRGDTVAVLLSADDVEGCSRLSSVSALLLNHTPSPRVLALSSPCISTRAMPAVPW